MALYYVVTPKEIVQGTPWGRVRTIRATGQRERYDKKTDTWIALPKWEKPKRIIVRHTPEKRWQEYRRLALAELDATFPTD